MISEQFCQMIRAQKRSVDQRLAMLLGHLPRLVDLEDGEDFRFSPRSMELPPLPFSPLLLGLLVFPQADASAVDLDGHAATGKVHPGGKRTSPPSQELTLPHRYQLRAQLLR